MEKVSSVQVLPAQPVGDAAAATAPRGGCFQAGSWLARGGGGEALPQSWSHEGSYCPPTPPPPPPLTAASPHRPLCSCSSGQVWTCCWYPPGKSWLSTYVPSPKPWPSAPTSKFPGKGSAFLEGRENPVQGAAFPTNRQYRESQPFAFCTTGRWAVGERVARDGSGLLGAWRRQITQFNRVSGAVADAVVSAFPSPRLLQQVSWPHPSGQAGRDWVLPTHSSPPRRLRPAARRKSACGSWLTSPCRWTRTQRTRAYRPAG